MRTYLKRQTDTIENVNVFIVMEYDDVNTHLAKIKSITDYLNGEEVLGRVIISTDLQDHFETFERLESWRFCITLSFSNNDRQPCYYSSRSIQHLMAIRPSVVIVAESHRGNPTIVESLEFLTANGAEVVQLREEFTLADIPSSLKKGVGELT